MNPVMKKYLTTEIWIRTGTIEAPDQAQAFLAAEPKHREDGLELCNRYVHAAPEEKVLTFAEKKEKAIKLRRIGLSYPYIDHLLDWPFGSHGKTSHKLIWALGDPTLIMFRGTSFPTKEQLEQIQQIQ